MELLLIIITISLIVLVFITKKKKITIFSGKSEIEPECNTAVFAEDEEIKLSFVSGPSMTLFTSSRIVSIKTENDITIIPYKDIATHGIDRFVLWLDVGRYRYKILMPSNDDAIAAAKVIAEYINK